MEPFLNKPKKSIEPETLELYMDKKQDTEFMNRRNSVFTSEFANGINSNKSVFDKQSTFRTMV